MLSRIFRESESRYKLLLGFVVTGVLTYLAYRELDLTSLKQRIAIIPVYPIVLCFLGQVCLQIFHALRWGTLLRKLEAVPWLKIYSLNVISNAALYILPMRLGELVRPTYAASQTQLKFSQTSSTSVIERAFDATIIGGFALVAIFSSRSSHGNEDILQSTLFLLLAVFLLFSFLILAARNPDLIQRLIAQTIGRILPRLSDILERFARQFTRATSEYLSIQTLTLYLGLSLLIWLTDTLSIYALFKILNAHFPFQAAFMALSLIVIGSFLPSGPGQLGVFEYSVAFGLTVFGMPLEDGVLIGALYHGILLGTILLMGLSGFAVRFFVRSRSK